MINPTIKIGERSFGVNNEVYEAYRALEAENKRMRGVLVEMLNIFDREGTAPREGRYSIGAMCCDRARAALEVK